MADTILSIDNLSRHYGRIKAVDGISLTEGSWENGKWYEAWYFGTFDRFITRL